MPKAVAILEGDSSSGFAPPSGGSWKPLGPSPVPGAPAEEGGSGRFFIQKGSRMNTDAFDEGFEEDTPF